MAYNPISETWYVDGPADALKAMCRRADVELKLINTYDRSAAWFKNAGTKLVRVSDSTKTNFLEPGETLTLDLNGQLSGAVMIPQVVALNNGV